jgi:alkylhydroperoxidase family enzyme
VARASELQELHKFYDKSQIVELPLAVCMANFTNCFNDALENIPDFGV